MEDHHRKMIKDNIDKLTSKTELNLLMNLCVKYKILSQIMKENLYKDFPKKEDCHRQLFIKITKRGPKAFNLLLDILTENFPSAEKVLCPEDTCQSIHDNKIMEGYRSKDTTETEEEPLPDVDTFDIYKYDDDDKPLPLEIYTKPTKHDPSIIVKKSTKLFYDERVGTYSMRSKYRGVFLMVNIINFPHSDRRNGAEIDRENLIHLFREFGYEVFYYEDLCLSQFRQVLMQLLNSNYTRRTESFVMALLTHGDIKDGKEFVEFSDGAVINLKDILHCFRNTHCSNLVGKPKVFIFPFCRGTISDSGTFSPMNRTSVQTDSISRTINNPTMTDIIIMYATVPGFKTHRDPKTGSWYIEMLCKVWAEHAHNTDIETLAKKVGEETGKIRSDNYLQTSSFIWHGVYKALYFNPGYYEDDAK